MWQFQSVTNPENLELWFSDGQAIDLMRGGQGVSSRLIVVGAGFLDITDFQLGFPYPVMDYIDFNGLDFNYTPDPSALFNLTLPGDQSFTVQSITTGVSVSGYLKALPNVSSDDATFLDQMVIQKYVPYQKIPDAPGKTIQEITALGLQLFPFSANSFELALSIYDWTTASFTRLVLMKIFEYTAMGGPPFPLDLSSIASAIWESNWNTYNPQNAVYMNSFMMTPATSLEAVQTQLSVVYAQLQNFSAVENRLLAAAFQSMPRTSVISKPQLFSGQLDIFQLGMEHFGIEFLECPLNSGPSSIPLQTPFSTAIATYVSIGSTITTKMVWSFGDSMNEAMKYQNGIVLVANPPAGAWVWDDASYITPLSDDPTKIEYTFAPGTQFVVQSIEQTQVGTKEVWIINIQPQPSSNANLSTRSQREKIRVGRWP
jgi:hypothetical protein